MTITPKTGVNIERKHVTALEKALGEKSFGFLVFLNLFFTVDMP